MYVQAKQTLLDVAAALVAVGAPFNAPKLCLFFNDVYPTRNTVIGELTIGNVGGFTNQQAVVWGAPFYNPNSQAEILGAILHWLTSAITGLPATAYGVALLDTAGAVVLWAERFANPFTFEIVGQNFSVVPRMTWA